MIFFACKTFEICLVVKHLHFFCVLFVLIFVHIFLLTKYLDMFLSFATIPKAIVINKTYDKYYYRYCDNIFVICY